MTENCPSGCSCNWKKPPVNERMLEMVRLLHYSDNYVDQTPGRNGITGLQHALRCGGLAAEYGEGTDAFIGVVHDLGRPLNDVHHGEVMAEMVRDRVDINTYEILRTHGQYQAAIVHGHDFPVHPWSQQAVQLAGWEERSFEKDYDGPTMTVADAIKVMEQYLG